jgi:signal peptidase
MRRKSTSRMRRTVGVAWFVLLVGVLGLAGAAHLAPHTGHTLLVIRGASMEPAVTLGSAVAVKAVAPEGVVVGDVVAVRTVSGVVVTHRVVEIVTSNRDRSFTLRGDANETEDLRPVPASALVGRVAFSVPYAGYGLFLLSLPSGIASIMSLLAAVLLAYFVLEDLDLDRKRRARRLTEQFDRPSGATAQPPAA